MHRLTNAIEACLAGADAVYIGIMAVAAVQWEGSENAKRAGTAVMAIRMLVLLGGS